MAIQPDTPRWGHCPDLLDADGTRPLRVVCRDRRDARQGRKDRVRADAGVRDRDRQDPGGDQEAGRARGALMRTATTVELSSGTGVVDFVVEAEKLGLDECWVAEAWGADAPSALGYIAARTDRMLLGSGILQLGIRSPV